jgi:homoserine kinase
MDGKHQRVRVRVPATTANLGPGFDCLGLALQLYNEIELTVAERGELRISVGGSAATDTIPRDRGNLVYRAAMRLFEVAGQTSPGAVLHLTINTPLARGLGSSASAIVGGMSAANHLLGRPLPDGELLREIVAMEGHPDNVVACLHGGLTAAIAVQSGIQYQKYAVASNVRCVLLIPGYELATAKARQAIPKSIPHRDAVFNLSRVPFVIAKLISGDLCGLADAMDDRLHQPYRKGLIRAYDVIVSEAEKAGAAAVCLSGAGPTMLAVCDKSVARTVAAAMRFALDSIDVPCDAVVVESDYGGARVIDSD